MIELLKNKLKEEYNIDAEKIIPYKGLLGVGTSQEFLLTKKYYDINIINKVCVVSETLSKKGFQNFPQIIKSNDGYSFFEMKGDFYLVMSYLRGRSADYANIKDVKKVIKVLSDFHQYGCFDDTHLKLTPRNAIQDKLKERLALFKRIYQYLLHKEQKDIFDKKVLEIGELMVHYGQRAILGIDTKLLKIQQEKAIHQKKLSHRDVASHNFIIGDKVWIIDFDLVSFEPQLVDVFQLLNRVMVEWQWDIELYKYIENLYYKKIRLSINEKKLIHQLSHFPSDFFREIVGVYMNPEKYKKDNVINILNVYYEYIGKYSYFQKQLK